MGDMGSTVLMLVLMGAAFYFLLIRPQQKRAKKQAEMTNALAPGAIETDFAGGLVRDNPHINAQLAAHTALGRVGLPEDIGAMAAVLLSDEAGWMTAQRVEASGGMFV